MCTSGVLRTGEDEYLLFKNKDFGRKHFDDRIVLEPEVFGVEGITTWAGDDPDRDLFSGFSIGANQHGLLCCDTNVRTLPDHANYDDLVEIALREGEDVASAITAIERAVEAKPYLWGNLVMIDGLAAAAVEVRGAQVGVTLADPPLVRSNHHVVFGAHPQDDDSVTSHDRLVSAERRIREATTIEDVFALQESHDNGDTGVCNHSLYDTVYSYVLTHRSGQTVMHVTQGHPCERPDRLTLPLPLGSTWSEEKAESLLRGYPSSRVALAR